MNYQKQDQYLRDENKRHTAEFKQFDATNGPPGCIEVWRNNGFLVQIFAPADGAQRITICRTRLDLNTGGWLAGITWDEIQHVKSKLGYGDRCAVELYPPDTDIINVANMRHIWLIDTPAFAWKCKNPA